MAALSHKQRLPKAFEAYNMPKWWPFYRNMGERNRCCVPVCTGQRAPQTAGAFEGGACRCRGAGYASTITGIGSPGSFLDKNVESFGFPSQI